MSARGYALHSVRPQLSFPFPGLHALSDLAILRPNLYKTSLPRLKRLIRVFTSLGRQLLYRIVAAFFSQVSVMMS